MTSRVHRLVAVWVVLAGLAVWVTATNAGQGGGPSWGTLAPQYFGDACQSTCPPPDECSLRWIRTRSQNCCIWDWGCWLNPSEPNYQIKPCQRDEWECVWLPAPLPPAPPSGGRSSNASVANNDSALVPQTPPVIRCCQEAYQCQEVDGNPCCDPVNALCP
ncbi:MAG: hypothetical protein HPY54_00380 [Chthonomonadetes bacterium]|nr:hypothetical protein [Chthonomonadetes bacterium]